MSEIRTCAASLTDTRVCCTETCDQPPVVAALTEDNSGNFVEHLRCDRHAQALAVIATKPYTLDPLWETR